MLLRAAPRPPCDSMASTARPPTVGGRPLNEVLDGAPTTASKAGLRRLHISLVRDQSWMVFRVGPRPVCAGWLR
jgi:hypothetical protein